MSDLSQHTTHEPGSSSLPSVAILGADALLAARPATPVQLAHACLVAGYSAVFPATWGDEIVAAAYLDRIGSRTAMPTIACACPRVEERLLASGHDLAPYLVTLASPPVATARYLRALYGQHRIHITYVGRCPGANDEAIEETRAPEEFLAFLAERNIDPADQPYLFDSVIPPDRRRYYSIPGGIPATQWLSSSGALQLVELDSDDLAIDLAQILLAEQPALVDVTPSVGCWCSGGTGTNGSRSMRKEVVALEPPRARSEILDPSLVVDVQRIMSQECPTAPHIDEEGGVADADPRTVDFVSHVTVADVPTPDTSEPVAFAESAPPTHPPPIAEARESVAPFDTSPVLADAIGEIDESPLWSGVVNVPSDLLLPISTLEPAAPEARVSITAEPVAPTEPSAEPLTISPMLAKSRRSFTTAPVVLVGSGRALPRAYVARRRSGDDPMTPVAAPLPELKESDSIVAQPDADLEAEPVRRPTPATTMEAIATTQPVDATEPVAEPAAMPEPVPTPEPLGSSQVWEDKPGHPPPAGRTVTIPLPPTHLRPVPRPGSERPALLVVIVALSIAAAALAYQQLSSGRGGRPASSGNGAPASVDAATPSSPAQSMPVRMDSNPQTSDTLSRSSTGIVTGDSTNAQTPRKQPVDSTDAFVFPRRRSELPAGPDSTRDAILRRRARIDSMARAMKTP
ncbi:MAG: [Fe-Fe] hydrogenase large subunit C-terminal domain-containing protein [Gemmatimonadaceae bacterium]